MVVTQMVEAASNKREKRMRNFWIFLMAFVLLAGAPASFAQKKNKADEQNRSVKGAVKSVDEQSVTGAVVQLKNTKTLQVRSFITKDDGTFYFHGLSPDIDYELKADYQGASSDKKTLSSFDSRKEAIINLKLNAKK